MAAIKGWIYIVLGIIMSISSQLVNKGTKPLRFFLYVGILFIIIGIGKYVFRSSKPEQKAADPNAALDQQQFQQQQNHQARTRQRHHDQMQYQHQQANTNASFQQSQPPSHFAIGKHQIQKVSGQPTEHVSIIACPLCGTRHYDYAHYCMKCGTRMKDVRDR